MKIPKRAARILKDERIVEKRKKIIKHVWSSGAADQKLYHQPGRLKKYNLRCSCSMCSMKDDHRPGKKSRELEDLQ